MDINWQSISIYGDFVTSLTAYYSCAGITDAGYVTCIKYQILNFVEQDTIFVLLEFKLQYVNLSHFHAIWRGGMMVTNIINHTVCSRKHDAFSVILFISVLSKGAAFNISYLQTLITWFFDQTFGIYMLSINGGTSRQVSFMFEQV